MESVPRRKWSNIGRRLTHREHPAVTLTTMNVKKILAVAGITTALGLGAVAAGSALPVGAQSSPSGTGHPVAAYILQSALHDLVADGTLTQAQADAVTRAVQGKAQQVSRRLRFADAAFDTAAGVIGVSPDDLRAAVHDGDSIASVAQAHDVEPSAVVDAIVESAGAHLDAAVAAGHLTQDEADALRAKVPDLAQQFVDHAGPWFPQFGSHAGTPGGG
jgi:hypothetical protein